MPLPNTLRERDDGEMPDEASGTGSDYQATLDALGLVLAKTRSEAIEGRANCGIEDEWLEDEEFYEGIDDANRIEHRAWRSKPLGQVGALSRQDQGTSSTVFLNITRPYTDAAAARVGDMLLPTDDTAWAIKPTPIPGMGAIADGKIPTEITRQIEQRFPGDPQAQGAEAAKFSQQAKTKMDEAKEKAGAATKRIEDWHVECQFHAEMRTVIDDCSKSGTGIMKGPILEKRKTVVYKDGVLEIAEETKPGSRRIDYWNFYPDPGCGERIHDGTYTWERDDITPKALMALKGLPGYVNEQINECLREGPSRATKEVPERVEQLTQGLGRDGKNLFEIWYCHTMLDQHDLIAIGKDVDPETPILVPAQVTMVNNRVIKVAGNPLDTGDFPYDIMVWQARTGLPWGIGVPRQVRTPQRIVKGAARNMMDNAGRSGGPQLVLKQGTVMPANGIYEIVPWGIWLAAEDADLDHLDNAFRFVTVPMLQKELEAIVYMGLKLAEDTTGIPMIMQGQTGESTPDTLGGMQMLQNNASSVLRRIARLYDDRLTEPHIRRYYTYLLQYGEEEEKGDYQIDARGSSALVERDLQAQQILQMGSMVANPIFGLDPKKWMSEHLKSQRLDPKKFEYDDEEWKQVVEQMAQQPQDQSLAVAQLRSEVDIMRLKMEAEAKNAELQVQVSEAEQDREVNLVIEAMRTEIEQMKLEGNKDINLDSLETKLADSAMKLRTQLKLANMSNAMKAVEVATPPTEPPGRAEPGKAYQE